MLFYAGQKLFRLPESYKLLSLLPAPSLRALPMLVIQTSVTIKKAPGKRIIHHAPDSNALSASVSILPQEIISRGSPIPMKLKVDSDKIALRTFITTINMIEEIKLGAR